MCNPAAMAVANFGFKAVSAYAEHQGKKDIARKQALANTEARKSANKAYGEDLTRIEASRIAENEKLAAEKFGIKIEKMDKLAEAQNRAGEGKGEVVALLRDIGFDADFDTNLIQSGIDTSNQQFDFARADAFAAMQRVYNNLPAVNKPNMLDLAIKTGSAAVESTTRYKKGDYGKV
tara:strand:- start:10 stop:540 length:531 start_codon:yes stop_codon:yes gene_type:complete